MSPDSVFSALSSGRIAKLIRSATSRVVYAAPGIQDLPAAALVELTQGLFSPYLTVSLDFDERTLRMGYGSLEATDMLRKAKIGLTHSPGFRSGILIVDERGWVFTPVAHYLEDEPHSDETPNAVELSPAQVAAFAIRFCPATRHEAMNTESDPEMAMEIANLPHELGINTVDESHFEEVKKAITIAPPVKFDIARQVRVFEPYLQYVEMKLTGAAIQKHRVQIPTDIQKLGASADLEGRLRTTFDLLEKSSKLSSEKLEEAINLIRKGFTPSLGKSHGRVVLKNAKPYLEESLVEFRSQLVAHQETVKLDLQTKLDESRQQVVEYYLPLAKANPPKAVIGGSMIQPPPDEVFSKWLSRRLEAAFPKAEALIQKMVLDVQFKDVTFETLNQPDFLIAVKKAFPDENWDKVYNEFRNISHVSSNGQRDNRLTEEPLPLKRLADTSPLAASNLSEQTALAMSSDASIGIGYFEAKCWVTTWSSKLFG